MDATFTVGEEGGVTGGWPEVVEVQELRQWVSGMA